MYEKIKSAVSSHSEKHRIVFWYDPDGRHREVVDELDLSADVLEIANNELWIKYRVVTEEPRRHFLIYAPYARPADTENWLLDLVLAGFSFSTDLSETYREELGLSRSFQPFIAAHVAFFDNHRDRFAPLAELIEPETETEDSLARKMISVLAAPDADSRRSAARFTLSLFALIDEAIRGEGARWDAIVRFGLDDAWRAALREYIPDAAPTVEPSGAAIEIFRQVWAVEQGAQPTRAQRNCRFLIGEWRDRFAHDSRYHAVVRWVERASGIAEELRHLSIDQLSSMSLFPAVDSELAHRLVAEAVEPHADWHRIGRIAEARVSSFWVRAEDATVRPIYQCLERIARFESALGTADLSPAHADELVARYHSTLYVVDQLYRQVLARYRAAGSPGTMADLVERVEGKYLHQYLQPLAETWDRAQAGERSPGFGLPVQSGFFEAVVAPFLRDNAKLVVIISDAMRFEVGQELAVRLRGENRLSVDHGAMLALAPTVTKVGMNALLPHETLRMESDGRVLVDERHITTTEGRRQYLSEAVSRRFPGKTAGAFRLSELSELSTAAARERMAGLDAVYIYSNTIDARSDNQKTELESPDAVEDELRRLVAMVRKITGQLNRTHVVITADHGYLYQSGPLVDAHMLVAETPDGGEKERRYVVGSESVPGGGAAGPFMTVADNAGVVVSESPLSFVEGLYRIKRPGGGTRFVHGGLSLQERIIPVVRVRAGRRDDTEPVRVAIMKPTNATITTPTYVVRFFQEHPVDEKHPAVTLRGQFFAADGTAISDSIELTFDSRDTNGENRGKSAEFHFGPNAVHSNGRTVDLVLERMVGGTAVPYARETFRYQTIGDRDF
ncbi:MAG: BREX-1 system phosphatase PglZ type A [Alkalispirochaeta sp.]